MGKYVKPEFKKETFNCPHCGAFAQIAWNDLYNYYQDIQLRNGYYVAMGACCQKEMIWQKSNNDTKMIYPRQLATPPIEDMPEKVKEIYKEASLVLGDSPRASCALLRLALQELMIYLRDNYEDYRDLKGKKIDDDIGILVKNHNLSVNIQRALDSIRIIGNNAVHPKELDINDNPDIAEKLFKMINLIVKEMITRPREINELYATTPQGARDAIEKRDS
ncbi:MULTISPECIES: DUF4145 domain-containing protein [unclassified Helicobacter]|uniref:DUF4145 domain-containing protein n=1 Tax=unclassified Helicobacter TaxID=2593540 RepID=UPI000CF0D6A3|nr:MULTISPECIES: DUF4145 domain-containing protein [unclassified Helicobacter]